VTPTYTIGDVTLLVNGETVAELKDIKMAGQYSSMTGYGLLIGRNTGTPVSHEYRVPFGFAGKLDKVVIDLK
jgi:arylsulfatase